MSEPEGSRKWSDEEIAPIVKRVHELHGTEYRYRRSVTSKVSIFLGGPPQETIHIFMNDAEKFDDWQQIMVQHSTGHICEPL